MQPDTSSLRLHEEVLLLALRDEKGTIEPGTMYHYALGGAILAELAFENRIEMDSGKRKLVNVRDTSPLGDPILDECLTKVAEAKRRGAAATWVSRFASLRDLKHRVAQGLCRKGILKEDEDQILLIFKRRLYPEIDPRPERALRERLRQAIFTEVAEVEPRTALLAALANGASLLNPVFGRKEVRSRKKRLEQIANGDLTVKATKEAIEAMQAAIMVAVMVPTICAATTVATSG